MLLVQSLLILSAPAYIRGVTDALLNRLPNSFVVTAKTARRSLDWRTLVRLPQFYALGIFLITGTVMTRLLFRNPSNYIMWIILFWIFVNCICLSHLFLFYGDETTAQSNDY
jgi:hypothetical protein